VTTDKHVITQKTLLLDKHANTELKKFFTGKDVTTDKYVITQKTLSLDKHANTDSKKLCTGKDVTMGWLWLVGSLKL